MKKKALLLGACALILCSCNKVENFSVTFETNGGTSISLQTIERGSVATKPTNPTKDNCVFIDWYKEKNFINVFDLSTPITSNIVLYAKWCGECIYKLNDDKQTYNVSEAADKTCPVYNIKPTYKNLPVTSIGEYAFAGCASLMSLDIPNSVTSFGECSFANCSSFKNTTIPKDVVSIADSAFYGCSFLTSLNIPNSVTSIGNETFYYCTRLFSITLPSSVVSIGYGSFQSCVSLKSISYLGTKEQWNSVFKAFKWHEGVPAKVVCCVDGEVEI